MYPNFEKFTLMKQTETTTSDSTCNNTVLAASGLPDIYSGALNEERIYKYRKLAEDYNVQLSTVRDIFCAGADWALSKAACTNAKGEERKD